MVSNTKIQWCDSSVNPVMGCDGCEMWCEDRRSCYAGLYHKRRVGNLGFAADFDCAERFPGRMAKAARLGDLTGLGRPNKPWLDGQPRMIFVSDMGDALSANISFEYLEAEIIDNVISPAGRRHMWLWVTKRPKRMAEFSAWLQSLGITWPTNLWVGTTVTTGKTIGRLDELSKVGDKQTTRFLSLEPQLEAIDLRKHLHGLDWVIQGGESGPDARPFDLQWVRQIRDQCREANVYYFLKQLGAKPNVKGEPLELKDGHGGDWAEWPKGLDLLVRDVPPAAVPGARPGAGTTGRVTKKANCCNGCPNGCIYCYARGLAVQRNQIAVEDWPKEVVREHDVQENRKHIDGQVMVPSTHDITPGNIDAVEAVLLNLLEAENDVLVFSKPRKKCIRRLCDSLLPYRDQVFFRFSIGFTNERTRRFWEPTAPTYKERLDCLQIALEHGFKTSVSAEPLLEPWRAQELLDNLRPFTTHGVWIGALNKLRKWTAWLYPNGHPEIDRLEEWQTEEKMIELYEALKDDPLVRWLEGYEKIDNQARAAAAGLDI